jgi:hypothetical protein
MSVLSRRQLLQRGAVVAAGAIAASNFGAGGGEASDAKAPETPDSASSHAPLVLRELYAPGHFGNSYEVMGPYEMRRYLAEARHWGFNRYGDWFDMIDCADPFKAKTYGHRGPQLWGQKKLAFSSAQALGMSCDLVITPNHVYLDQCRPGLLAQLATDGGSIKGHGQCICPSKPEARAIILQDYKNLFADLAAFGVRLNAISAFATDFGGCGCKDCRPWILTFAKLLHEIHAIGNRYHPNLENHMVSWQWSEEEHRLLSDWADREAPGWIKSVYMHMPYGATNVSRDLRLPKNCERRAFVHIGYADDLSTEWRDLYGVLGPVVAPVRLPQTVKELASSNVTGVMAYSEGVLDDVNKSLLAGLGSGKHRTCDEVLRAYARRYFGADEQLASQWSSWLAAWGRPSKIDPKQAAQQLAALKRGSAGGWRQQQWELKLELFRLYKVIRAQLGWTPARLEVADQFGDVLEKIHRGLWGLSPDRHIFDFAMADWQRELSDHLKVVQQPVNSIDKDR